MKHVFQLLIRGLLLVDFPAPKLSPEESVWPPFSARARMARQPLATTLASKNGSMARVPCHPHNRFGRKRRVSTGNLKEGEFHMPQSGNVICSILPPHILRKLADKPNLRDRILHNIAVTERLRGIRQAFVMPALAQQPGTKHRTIFDAQTGTTLPGTKVRDEGDAPSSDIAVNEAYDYCGDTYDFYQQVFNRNSVDDHGLTLKSTV